MADASVEIEGRLVRLSTLDRVIWPLTGTTKAQLVDYYAAVAPVLLPHLVGRPVTLRRFPEGVDGPGFFQTRCPPHPPWVTTATMHFPRTGKTFDAAVIDDVASLVWAANLSTVEFHPFLHRVDDAGHPSYLVFDLDPGPPAGPVQAARVALTVRELLDADGLPAYPKFSGSKGIHVFAPLDGSVAYADAKHYARSVATTLARQRDDVVDTMTRSLRPGKVLIDWSQNDPGKSTVGPYSLRALRPRGVDAAMLGRGRRCRRDR